MKSHPLTPARFDSLVVAPPDVPKTTLWGAKAIAAAINCTEEFVCDVLAKETGTPIRKIGRRYCVMVEDLTNFIRRKD